MKRVILSISIAAILLPLGTAAAATFTWDGHGGGGNGFSNANNWTGNASPPSAASTDLIFSTSAAGRTVSFQEASSFILHSLTIGAANTNWTQLVGGLLDFRTSGTTPFIAQNSTIAATITNPLTLTNDLGVGVTSTGGLTLEGVISGGSALTKTGSGTLTLTAANNYTGTTRVSGGTLALSGSGAIASGNASSLFIDGPGTLSITGTASVSVGSAFVGFTDSSAIGQVSQNGGSFTTSSFLTLGFLNNVQGFYQLQNGSVTTAQEQIADAATTAIFQQLGGTHTTGTLDVGSATGANGTYQLTGGTLTASSITHTGGTGTFNFNGGTLKPSASNTTFFQSLTTANVQAGGAKIDTNSFDITIAQALLHDAALGGTADGGLTKSGLGTLTLTGTNTYTGATTINAGTLAINNGAALGTGNVTVNNGGTLLGTANLTLTNPNIMLGTGSTTAAATGMTLTLNSGNPAFGGAIIFGNALNTGVVAISSGGSVTDTSTIQVAFGTLKNAGSFLSFATTEIASTTVDAGATLDTFGNETTIRNLLGAGTLTNDGAAAATFTLQSGTFAGVIKDGTSVTSLTKNTTGTLVLSGSGDSTFTGNFNVNDGTVQLIKPAGFAATGQGALIIGDGAGAANSDVVQLLQFSQISNGSNVTINSDGRFDMSAIGETINNLTINGGNVIGIQTNGINSLALNGVLNLTGGTISGGTGATPGLLLAGGAGVSNVTATSDSSGNAATINSNVGLSFTGAQTRIFTVNDGPGAVDLSITGIILNGSGGASGLTKAGPGTMSLTGANTYALPTTVTGGTLAVTGAGALASTAVAVSSGTLTTDSDALAAGATVTVSGTGTFTSSGTDSYTAIDQTGGTINGTGVQTLSGAFTQSGGTTGGSVDINAATFTQSGGATIAAGTTVTSSGAQTLQGGTIRGTLDGTGAVTISTGTTSLLGAGAIINAPTIGISSGGTLASDGDAIADAAAVTNNGTLTLTGAETIGGLLGGGTLNLTGATLTTGNGSNNTFSGTVQGSGGLTVQGAGVTKLEGNIAHTGTTTVNSGTLSVETFGNTRTIGPLVVNGGTLKLDNAVVTAASLAGTGTVSLTAANGASQLTVGGNNADTTFAGSITGTGGTNFVKAGTGTLTLTGSSQQSAVMVLGGTLAVTGSGTLGANALFVVDGTLLTDSDALAATTEVLVQDTSTFTTSGTDSYTALSQTGGTIGGSGIQTLSGAFFQDGGTTGGTVDINAATFTQSGGATIGAGTTVTSSGAQALQGGTIRGTLDGGGAVTISLGTTTLAGAGSITNAAVSVANGATLAIRPGVNGASNNISGALTLGATSTFTMADGAASQLKTGALTLAGGASTLIFEIGGTATAAVDNILAFGPFDIAAAGGKITIQSFGTVANPAGTYPLITFAVGGSLTTNQLSLASTRLVYGGKAYPLTLANNGIDVQLTVGAAAGVDQAFWKGDVNGSWTTNNAGNTNWATDASGRTDLGSVPGNLTDVIFSAAGAGNLTTTGSGGTVNSITFTSGSGAVSIGGPGIRLLGAGANNLGLNVIGGGALRTVSAGLAPDIDQTWVNDGAFGVTTLTLSGGIFSAGTARQLTVAGRGNTLLSGSIAANSVSSLIKTGTGTLTVGSAGNAFVGPVTINGGVIAITADGNLGNAANDVTLNAGGTLRFGATITLGSGRSLVVSGSPTIPSGLDLSAGITGTLAHPTALTGAGTLLLSTTGVGAASTLSVEEVQAFTGELVVGAPGKLVGDTLSRRIFSAVSGLIVRLRNAGRLASASRVTVNNGSTLQISQGATPVLNRIAAALTFNNGRFQYDPAGSSAINDTFGAVSATGLLTINGGATAGPAAGTTLTFGTFTRTDNATLGLQVTTSGQGSIGGAPGVGVNYKFSGLTDSGGPAGTPSRGIVPWAAAATVAAFPADFSTLVTYDSNGFRPLAASEINQVTSQTQFDNAASTNNVDAFLTGNVAVNGAKTINALTAQGGLPTFTGSGVLTLASGAIANLNTVTFNGAGLNLPASGGYFHLGFPVVVQGTSAITGGVSSGLTVSSLNADSDHQLRLTNTVANTFTGGLFINGNAQVTFTANNQLGQIALLDAGAITLGGGQLLYAGATSATLSDGGTARPITVNASGGTIGATTNVASLTIPGTISGAGQVQIGGGTQSNANGRVELTNPAANTYTGGTLISPGILRISNPNQLGTGPILLNGGTLQASAALNFTTPLTVVQDSTLDLVTRNVTLSGGISGSAGATGAAATSLVFTATGSALLVIDGDSTFAGTLNLRTGRALLRGTLSGITAITTDSTLQLGISDGISDSAALTFTGGALETQGFSDTVGALTIGNSFSGTSIDLGTGASILRFAASQAQPWTGTLSITNWSGSTLGGGTDQLFFGTDTTGLSAGQRTAITFLDPAGFAPGTYPAAILATGEIVAVPEPGSGALLLAGLAVFGIRLRRRP